MKKKITFHNMPHSQPLEDHSIAKLQKLNDMLGSEDGTPLHAELWLKANKLHPHHAAELHLKTPHLDLNSHSEGADMYIVIDQTIDKMVTLLVKEKDKRREKTRKQVTEKNKF